MYYQSIEENAFRGVRKKDVLEGFFCSHHPEYLNQRQKVQLIYNQIHK